MKTVMHMKHKFLPISETFIYDQVANIKKYNSVVLAESKLNSKNFPYKKIYVSSESKKHHMNWILYRTIGKSTFYDKIIKKINPDIFHAHFGNDGVFFLPLKKKFNKPFLTSFYGKDASVLLKSKYWLKQYKKLFIEGDKFLALSEFVKNKIVSAGCKKEKVVVQRLGINTSKFRYKKRKEKDNLNIIFVGRLVEKKGGVYLMKAFEEISKKYDNVNLKIIGDGPERVKMKKLAKRNNKIKFFGSQTHDVVKKELYNSDIFTMPSITASDGDTEGQGAVILEAQATGLPVVSTYHNGIPEAVKNNDTGLLVKEKDYKNLAKKIEYLINNKKARVKYGIKGSKNVKKNFEMKKQIKKLENIYSEFC